MQNKYIIQISPIQAGLRLDTTLSSSNADYSRSKIQEFIKQNCVSKLASNTKVIINNTNHKVKEGETYELIIPIPEKQDIKPLNMQLDVLYEDEYLMVINKPKGLTVHPGAGNKDNTLVNVLAAHLGDNLSNNSGDDRRGIVHRLDKNTSGILVVAKNNKVHQHLSEQFASHTITRKYHALVWGVPHPIYGEIDNTIARSEHNRKKMAVMQQRLIKQGYVNKTPTRGKRAITIYNVLNSSSNNSISLVDCELKTGRTHQIRVHLSNLGCPLVNDDLYGGVKSKYLKLQNEEVVSALQSLPEGQVLHAYLLHFIHPITLKKLCFEQKEEDNILKLYNLIFSDVN